MSEYQYYEFLAVDKPLTRKQMSALRSLSTRADITPTSFTNEYHWGDFKGNPLNLMQRFFDAHVYVANWMTAVFMVRLPIRALPRKAAEAMAVNGVLDFDATKTHWVITWLLEEGEDYDRFAEEDGRGWMGRLAPIREELLRGDLRSLYIGWLAAVTMGIVDDDDSEPLPMAGLENLTGAQQALAEFLEVDPDLLAGAGIGNTTRGDAQPGREIVDQWLENLPRKKVLSLLRQVLEGEASKAERLLKDGLAEHLRGLSKGAEQRPRRSVETIRQNAKIAEEKRLAAEKRREARRTARQRKERKAYLATLARDFSKAWKLVEHNVERGLGPSYDQACRALVDLSEAYALHRSPDAFTRKFRKFMAPHERRRALIKRLVKAGLWNEKKR